MDEHKFESHYKKTGVAEYVTIAIAEDMELAKEYQEVLNNNNIPAVLRTQRGSGNEEILGIAIMVPEEASDPAITIIESQQAFDDFLDTAFNSEDNDDDKDNDYFDDFEEERNLDHDYF